MGNTRSVEAVSEDEPCLGRFHHESTDDTTEKRYEDDVKGAKGNVSSSEEESEASDGDTPPCSRGCGRDEEVSKSKGVEGTESTPAHESGDNPPTKSEAGGKLEKSEMDKEQSELCVEDRCSMKNISESPGGETKEYETSDSEEQSHKTDDTSAVSSSYNASRMDGDSVTQKDGYENELGEKEKRKSKGILSKVIMGLKNSSLRRKQESDVITERDTTSTINTDDFIVESEIYEKENTQRVTKGVTEAGVVNENSGIPLKKKGKWKKFFTQLTKKKHHTKRQDREVKNNTSNKKRKMKFFTFMTRIKELDRSDEVKGECSNSSSDSVIYRDINIDGGDKENEESKSDETKEKNKEEYEREQLEEKEQWRWDAEECGGGSAIKKRR